MIEPKEATPAQPTPAAADDAEASGDAQDTLTQSVGRRLTREQHDGQASWWKRLLGNLTARAGARHRPPRRGRGSRGGAA